MNLSMIVATDLDGCIGVKGEIPWKIAEDLKVFREITLNHVVVMGRKTFESCGFLDNRINIVLSTKEIKDNNVIWCDHIGNVLTYISRLKNDEVFIIGGSEIYELFMPYINKIYITKIETHSEGDTFIPKIDWSEWKMIKYRESYNDEYSYKFYEYIKNN